MPRAEYSLVCIGLTKAGKTTLLSVLCNENADNVTATTGFVIKPCQFKDCILQIKEIGGGEKQRPFWRHYYHDAQAVVFVIDSACNDDEMGITRTVLHDALADPNLTNLPCLLLANCQDKIGARTEQQVSECLDLPSVCAVRPCELILCSATKDGKHIHHCFESFIDHHLSSHHT